MRGLRLHLSFVTALAGMALLTLMASSATAAAPALHYHFAFTCTATPTEPAPTDPDTCVGPNGHTEIEPVLCDIPGTTVDSQSGNVQIFADGTRKVEWTEHYVFTSALTGKSIESRSHFQLTNNTDPIDNGNGTVSLVFVLKGLEQQLKLPNGSLIARDAGPVTFTFTIDLATDEVSIDISEKGPHPIIDSGFCAVVVPALS